MTNVVKESLQENMNAVLENLPEEFHGDFKSSVESAEPSPRLSVDEAKEQAKQLMIENPDIEHEECIPLIDSDRQINQPVTLPNKEELQLQKQDAISEIEAGLPSE